MTRRLEQEGAAPPARSRASVRSVRVMQITDRRVLAEDELLARVARSGPGFAVQLRDPLWPTRELLRLGASLRVATREVGALLLVNDRLDVALALDADGVHLGRRSMGPAEVRKLRPELSITCSAHSADEAVALSHQEVDAVLLSPIFASPTKGAPLGVDVLSDARARMAKRTALLALGGVGMAEVPGVLRRADGVASIRADLTPAIHLSPVR